MNNSSPGAIIHLNKQGQIISIDVIANSDKEADIVQQSLENISRPNTWARLKRLFPGG